MTNYVSVEQVKEYLLISSNTFDARLSSIISYASSAIENYIGQPIVANDYVETFDGGKSSVFTSRIPLHTVYHVSEFTSDGTYRYLSDPNSSGRPIIRGSAYPINKVNTPIIDTRTKKFDLASMKITPNNYIQVSSGPECLSEEDNSYTIEFFTKFRDSTLQNYDLVRIVDTENSILTISSLPEYGIKLTNNVDASSETKQGANAFIEMRQFAPKAWAHIAIVKNYDTSSMKIFYNGNIVSNSSTFTNYLGPVSNIDIGPYFNGHIDNFRISSNARYLANFTTPVNRFTKDQSTELLINFDQGSSIVDSHSTPSDYTFSSVTGEVTTLSTQGGGGSPKLSLLGHPTFSPYPNGVTVAYRAGYEIGEVPSDLVLATLDYIKMLHKQDQEKQTAAFEGDRTRNYNLSSNFPPHIKRILDMYRIIQ